MIETPRCPVCGKDELHGEAGHYHFVESGLANVHLLNVGLEKCRSCGEEILSISNPNGLMDAIAEAVILKPGLLTGAEIRFLRKRLHLRIVDFAHMLGIERGSLSRIENGKSRHSGSIDRLVRSIHALRGNVSDPVKRALANRFGEGDAESQMDYILIENGGLPDPARDAVR